MKNMFCLGAFAVAHRLRQDWANLIASDAHWVGQRNTDWTDAFDVLPEGYGPRRMERCVKENPFKILQGQKL